MANSKAILNRNGIFIGLIIVIVYSFWKARLGLHWDELTAIEEGVMIQKGAHFITEDWAPLQLTAIILSPLLTLWKMLFGSYAGVILGLRYIYLLMQFGIGLYIYCSLKHEYGKKGAYLVALMHYLFFYSWTTINYKSMLYMGGIVTIISIYNYCKSNKIWYLILASIASVYMIIGYPHALLICVAFCLAIWKLAGSEKKKGLSVYVICCGIMGMTIFLYLLVQCGGVQQLVAGISGILSDEYHTGGLWVKARKLILPLLIMFIAENVVAFLGEKIILKREKLKTYKGIMWFGVFSLGLLCICLGRIHTAGPSRFWYVFLSIFLLTPCFLGESFGRKHRKEVYLFILPSVFMILSIMVATNQGIAIVAYGSIWGLMGLVLAICQRLPEYKPVIIFIVAAMSILFVVFVPDMAGGSANIFWEREEITDGTARGIYVEKDTKEKYYAICNVVNKYVDADDHLLIVSDPFMAAGYMNTDAIEATFAPDYIVATTDRYVTFYEGQPHRAPNVIILDKEYVGDIDTYLNNSSLGQYINSSFEHGNNVEDGKFVIYYAEERRI